MINKSCCTDYLGCNENQIRIILPKADYIMDKDDALELAQAIFERFNTQNTPEQSNQDTITISKEEYYLLKYKIFIAENNIKVTQMTNEHLLKENKKLIKYHLERAYK